MVGERLEVVKAASPAAAGGSSALPVYLTVAAIVGFATVLICGVTGAGYFWR